MVSIFVENRTAQNGPYILSADKTCKLQDPITSFISCNSGWPSISSASYCAMKRLTLKLSTYIWPNSRSTYGCELSKAENLQITKKFFG